jgi:hypothetical protein
MERGGRRSEEGDGDGSGRKKKRGGRLWETAKRRVL